MDNRFEQSSEAGGEQQQLPHAERKLSWRDRFYERFRRHEARKTDDSAEVEQPEQVSFSAFVRGIFRKDEEAPAEDRNFIDQAFEDAETARIERDRQRLGEMNEQERTEFFMVVAQRFKDAGERMLNMFRGDRPLPETVDGSSTPEIAEVRAMYADTEKASPAPVEEAPPFDFAVEALPEIPRTERSEPVMHDPSPVAHEDVSEVGVIDDFDYVVGRDAPLSEDERPRIHREGDVKTVEYRPRLRDILFASAVGAAVGRREYKRGRRETEKKLKQVERVTARTQKEQEAQFTAAQERLRQEQVRAAQEIDRLKRVTSVEPRQTDIPKVEHEPPKAVVPPPLKQVQEAMKEVTKPAEDPVKEAQKRVDQAARRLAEAEAQSTKELRYTDLQPQAKRIDETADRQIEEASFFVEHRTAPSNPGVKITNPFEEELRHSREVSRPQPDQPEVKEPIAQQQKPAIAPGPEAVAVKDIISDRIKQQSSPQPSSSFKQSVKSRYGMDTQSGTNNWIATAVILSLILIGLLFISAV